MADRFEPLLAALSVYEGDEATFNPYHRGSFYGRARLANLHSFLTQRQTADTLLLMEAPGYRGCRVTGVPVTSRRVMSSPLLHGGLFAPMPDEQVEPAFRPYLSEQSATIVWQALADLNAAPLLWNAFPFHPHPPQQPTANRTPRATEVQAGLAYLQALLGVIDVRRVVAVGNVAARALTLLGVDHTPIRHPAQGGKHDFVRGLRAALGDSL
jgi:hypothetical protein